MTRLTLALALVALLAAGGPGPAAVGRVSVVGRTASRYSAPVLPLLVVRGFQPPPTPYSAGHRGVDLATAPGAAVRAAADGRVSFAAQVAGRGVVVIAHPDGVSTEYEPVRPVVRAGAAVARGQPIGHVHGTHGSFPADRCLHWGARRAGAYFDPLTLLRPLGPVRLLPWR